jgi:hypothetical protein
MNEHNVLEHIFGDVIHIVHVGQTRLDDALDGAAQTHWVYLYFVLAIYKA